MIFLKNYKQHSDQMISFTHNPHFLFFIFFSSIPICSALTSCGPFSPDTATFFLCDGQTIESESAGEIQFQLGFFTPNGNLNKSRYLGIWYLSDPETIVWVANRDTPLPENSTGSFGVRKDGDGNLRLLDENGNSYFSTEIESSQSINFTTARLLEGGNLVLMDEKSGKILWQSFDHPTDTFLPGMKMTDNLTLISWTSTVDPSAGKYRFRL